MKLRTNAKNWAGVTNGDATIVGYIGHVNARSIWRVRCVCGEERQIRSDYFAAGGWSKCNHALIVRSIEALQLKNQKRYLKRQSQNVIKAAKYRQLLDRTPRYRFIKGKSNAKARGLPWLLTLEEYAEICDRPCFYCLGQLGKTSKGSGLDRLDNEGHYVASNVVPCCTICNRIKNDSLSPEETQAAVQAVIRVRQTNKVG